MNANEKSKYKDLFNTNRTVSNGIKLQKLSEIFKVAGLVICIIVLISGIIMTVNAEGVEAKVLCIIATVFVVYITGFLYYQISVLYEALGAIVTSTYLTKDYTSGIGNLVLDKMSSSTPAQSSSQGSNTTSYNNNLPSM